MIWFTIRGPVKRHVIFVMFTSAATLTLIWHLAFNYCRKRYVQFQSCQTFLYAIVVLENILFRITRGILRKIFSIKIANNPGRKNWSVTYNRAHIRNALIFCHQRATLGVTAYSRSYRWHFATRRRYVVDLRKYRTPILQLVELFNKWKRNGKTSRIVVST